MLAIDLSKAFDSINLKCLINKLEELGIAGKSLKLFETFLLEREQIVEINQVKSDIREIKTGIPQSSMLAATLFLIYINNVFNLKLQGRPQFYADDGSFMYATDTLEDLIQDIQADIHELKLWSSNNALRINLEKTNFIIFQTFKPVPPLQVFNGIKVGESVISRVDKMKYLALWIDHKLNWNEHVNTIKQKLIPLNFAINRNKNKLPKEQLLLLYNAYFMSHINYLNPIWNR